MAVKMLMCFELSLIQIIPPDVVSGHCLMTFHISNKRASRKKKEYYHRHRQMCFCCDSELF